MMQSQDPSIIRLTAFAAPEDVYFAGVFDCGEDSAPIGSDLLASYIKQKPMRPHSRISIRISQLSYSSED